jgi:hypothetical protein
MSFKSVMLLSVFIVSAQLSTFSAEARRHNHRHDDRRQSDNRGNRDDRGTSVESSQSQGDLSSDAALVSAVNGRRRLNFVQGGNMTVIKVLPDDNQGLKHQKWIVRLSNGSQLMGVYNSDMCERVPLKAGDVIAMGGQFIWTNEGGLLHWLHHDPRNHRPDGFVQLNGKFYCKD